MHETTIAKLGEQFESDLMPNTNVGQWRASGEPDIRKKAIEKAMSLIESYKYNFDPVIKKRIDQIYAEAKKYAARCKNKTL